MSVRIAPEPVSVAISFQALQQTGQDNSVRALEPSEGVNADRQDNPNKGEPRSAADKKARAPDRAPGKDPSSVPQALFDAALIAAEYRAGAVATELAEEAELEALEPDAGASDDSTPQASAPEVANTSEAAAPAENTAEQDQGVDTAQESEAQSTDQEDADLQSA
jgi:hypothetical protein